MESGWIDYFYFEIDEQVKIQKTTFHTDELMENCFSKSKSFKALSTKEVLEVLRHSHMLLKNTKWHPDSFSTEDSYTKKAIDGDQPWNMFTPIQEILAVRKAINIM
ncbi:hypothetical protein [Abyssogena phaseoliformis symbiont]|uniref:hypothetical protein n=1 Tax=Abyssogena phaseoliformis symbiont TaxID=596095 RepID=UPI001916619D|nr:hypothetical protein [Abyssogena phaseoliformis symbiont]MBW5288899.1 hypothetical protein [Candidatus Ruthia sp. Apha_13_S6]